MGEFDGGSGKRGVNPYIPIELLDEEQEQEQKDLLENKLDEEFLEKEGISIEEANELIGFNDKDEWDLLDTTTTPNNDDDIIGEERDFDINQEEFFFDEEEDEIWMS